MTDISAGHETTAHPNTGHPATGHPDTGYQASGHQASWHQATEHQTVDTYRRFAAQKARGRSPLYELLANRVAHDQELIDFLDKLPAEKRQPNLLLAAVRYLAGLQSSYEDFRSAVLDRRDDVAATMLARRTQTNEPARCATMLPALAALPQPVALLEVGASAGLCLFPDRYTYDYGVARIDGFRGAPVLSCRCLGPVLPPLPQGPIDVVWRRGIDLNPLDVNDDDDVRWLTCLVWPGEGDRAERLAAAVTVARSDPPRLVRGDLLDRLDETAADAPRDATLVVLHSSVLGYVSRDQRRMFAQAVDGLGAEWIAQETPRVMADLATYSAPLPPPDANPWCYVLTRGGRDALAYADAHGTWIRWIAARG